MLFIEPLDGKMYRTLMGRKVGSEANASAHPAPIAERQEAVTAPIPIGCDCAWPGAYACAACRAAYPLGTLPMVSQEHESLHQPLPAEGAQQLSRWQPEKSLPPELEENLHLSVGMNCKKFSIGMECKQATAAQPVLPSWEDELLYPEAERPGEEVKLTVDLLATVKSQLAIYDTLPESRDVSLNPLEWWRGHAWRMPHLAVLAQDLLGIPGASHALEQSFSRAGRAVDYRRRPRLSGETAACTMFCHENLIRGHGAGE